MNGWKWSRWLVVAVAVTVAGCSTSQEVDDADPQLEDCVSERGQRLLTFCASPEAAERAERQHAIDRSADRDGEEAQDMVSLPVDGAPVRGERDAPVTVHLFTDLSCRDCRSAYRRLSAEIDHRPGEMRLVFRHLPADQAGQRVARAAIAADEQGKFFEFLDELFERDEAPSDGEFADVARAAGLDVERWERDRRSPSVDAVLERDAIQAEDAGVVEAPTYFVNGIRKVGGVALQEFDEVADEEMAAVDSMRQSGLEGAAISWRRIQHNYRPVDWEEVDEAADELQRRLPVARVPVGNSPQRGAEPEESLTTVVVFADFLCPYSAESARIWNALLEEFGPRGLRVVFRHFPHPDNDDAERVAAASIIAQQGGVFWDYHDALFFGDVSVGVDQLESTLREMGWSGDDFAGRIDSPEIRGAVEEDRQVGAEAGVEGTPTIFVNGIRLEGVLEAEALAPLVADQLELGASVADLTGNQGEQLYADLVEANR